MADKIRRVDYFYVHVPDSPGEGHRILSAVKVADAGVNVHAANAACGPGGYGMILWVKPESYQKAAKALGV